MTIVNDDVALAARYATGQPGGNELWMMPTPAPATAGEHALPRMLLLPKRYALKLAAARGTAMPHNLRGWIEEDVSKGALTTDDAQLALDWCVGAATTTNGHTSVLAFDPTMVSVGGPNFDAWAVTRLRATGVTCKPVGKKRAQRSQER